MSRALVCILTLWKASNGKGERWKNAREGQVYTLSDKLTSVVRVIYSASQSVSEGIALGVWSVLSRLGCSSAE